MSISAVNSHCWRNPLRHFVRARSLSLWHGANFDIARATLSPLCACQIALVVARCEFWYRSCNHLGALHVSDRSCCGAVLILRSLAQPPQHFGRVRSFPRGGARSFGESRRSAQTSSQRPLLDILYRDLLQGSWMDIS